MLISAPTAGGTPAAYVSHQPGETQGSRNSTGIYWRPERSDRTLSSTLGSLFSDAELDRSLEGIGRLRRLREDWNGYGAAAPDQQAILQAASWTISLYKDVVAQRRRFLAPNVTANSDGDVVLEWWKGQKKLTVYMSRESAEYVKSWGSDIESEMEEGSARTEEERRALWDWLAS